MSQKLFFYIALCISFQNLKSSELCQIRVCNQNKNVQSGTVEFCWDEACKIVNIDPLSENQNENIQQILFPSTIKEKVIKYRFRITDKDGKKLKTKFVPIETGKMIFLTSSIKLIKDKKPRF